MKVSFLVTKGSQFDHRVRSTFISVTLFAVVWK